MGSITVMLVDDHKIMRQGLRSLLDREPDLAIVGEAGDGREAVQLARQLRPDVVVMDTQMPHMSGAEATRAIRAACPRTEVIALTMHDNEYAVASMLRAGARSYLLKESAGPDLADAIRATARGQSILDPAIARTVVEMLRGQQAPRADDILTPREREMLRFIAQGKTSREIAELLGLSAKTVDNCRSSILQKLGARNRVEAIALGVQRGLIPSVAAV
jgi:DNA-binding NarL/FixJ family response regulator